MKIVSFWVIIFAGLTLFSCKDQYVKHDLYQVWSNGLYGYINSDGVVEIAHQFAYAMPFSEGLAAVNVGGTPNGKNMPTDGRWGFIDTRGYYTINPIYHSPVNNAPPFAREDLGRVMHEAYRFREHVAAVRTDDGWRYIDTLGKPLQHDFELQSCRAFHEGMAAVMVEGYWGYVRKVRNSANTRDSGLVMVIHPDYLYPVDFQNGFAVVKDREGRKICINQAGKQVFSQYRIESQFHEGMAAVRARFRGEPVSDLDNRKFSLMDSLGRLWFEPQFDELGFFASGMIPVRVGSQSRDPKHLQYSDYDGGKWGFVNQNGAFLINPTYDGAKSFHEDRAAVKKGQFWGYLDDSGAIIAAPQFLWAGDFHLGIATVLLGPSNNDYFNHYAYLDRSGSIIWVEP